MPKRLRINFIHKDYGRSRGSFESADALSELAQRFYEGSKSLLAERYQKQFVKSLWTLKQFKDIYPGMVMPSARVYKEKLQRIKDYKKIYIKTGIEVSFDLLSEDKIDIIRKPGIVNILNFCMIQNPNQYGNYPLIATEDDIKFGKGFTNEVNTYVQSLLPAATMETKFFPKYYNKYPTSNFTRLKLEQTYERYRLFKKDNSKLKLKIAYYNREDTCPIQTKKYQDFIKEIKESPEYADYEFTIVSFGFGNDLSDGELWDLLNETDIVLYAEPDHRDIYPNTIMQAISCMCYIHHIDEYQNKPENPINGIYELKMIFPERFIELSKFKYIFEDSLFKKNPSKSFTAMKNKVDDKIRAYDLLTEYYLLDKIEYVMDKNLGNLGII